jgi:tRNA nucleotidyltransferase (CCA-adding enzyme)
MGFKAYLVGGMVRDILIGLGKIDLDITIDGDGVSFARTFAAKTGSVLEGPTEFGTCKVKSRAFGVIDLATARREIYARPGALPRVRQSGLELDLLRRDFTINAMAISVNPKDFGRLIDPFDGMADLRRKSLRVLHDGSFVDDPTRMLRGVRFAARYGFRFNRKTLRLLKACVEEDCLNSVSGKRIFTDLKLICTEQNALVAFRMLDSYGMLASMGKGLALTDHRVRHLRKLAGALEAVNGAARPGFASWWLCHFSGLFVGVAKVSAKKALVRFNPPKPAREVSMWASSQLARATARLARLDSGQAYRVTRLLEGMPPEAMVHLYAASGRRGRSLIIRYLSRWRNVAPELKGGDIAKMGAGESPLVGRLLERLLKLKLEGRLLTRNEEILYAKKYILRHCSDT